MRHKQRGFTLTEVLVALVIAVVGWAGFVGMQARETEKLKAARAAAEMRSWLEAGINYYVNNGGWPPDAATLVTANYMPAAATNNPWNNPYVISISGVAPTDQFAVNTTFGAFPNVGNRLPFATVAGNSVTAAVGRPGYDSVMSRYLNAYGDNGRNQMHATLDLNSNTLANATSITVPTGQNLSVTGGDGVRIDNDSAGLVVRNGSGTANSAKESDAGSIDVNDIRVRSLTTTNKYLSSRLGPFVMQESLLVTNGTIFLKPTCGTSGTAKVYLVPAVPQHASGVSGTVLADRYRALSLSPTQWQAEIVTFGPTGLEDGGTAIAMTYCYYS